MRSLSVADARANSSRIVRSASTTHERFEVTRNGDRAVVLLSADDYDALIETIEVLGDSTAVEAIRMGLNEVEAGETFDVTNVRESMIRAGRLTSPLEGAEE